MEQKRKGGRKMRERGDEGVYMYLIVLLVLIAWLLCFFPIPL